MRSPLALPSSDEHPPLALLVDRDSDTRHLYGDYLSLAFCDVVEASDGREALALALTRHPDVVVTETRLPGISGFDLCSLLRRDPATAQTRVVFVTGDGFPLDVERAERVGADAVLVKPCLPDVLLNEIHRLLRTSRDLESRAAALRERARVALEAADNALSRTAHIRPIVLSRSHQRHYTVTPRLPPPAMLCPRCDTALVYQSSYIGGVSARHPEQWDYFNCPAGCGDFQYRQRTQKLRTVQ